MGSSPLPVSDLLSNYNDQLVTAARLLSKSKRRQEIFEAVYRGQKQIKTIQEISAQTGLSKVHVLKEGGKVAGLLFEKIPGAYKKKKELATVYKKILSMAKNKKALEKFPTKVTPKMFSTEPLINIQFPKQAQNAILITIDDIDSFSEIRKYTPVKLNNISEEKIKEGFKKIIKEAGVFTDWGGERSDLFSTKVVFKQKHIATAIAFKGKGTTGKLVPGLMGKNGDQINRLFTEPAELFLIVYSGQIDSSILTQMKVFAIAAALGGKRVYYGIVDESDLGRLVSAYPEAFR
jgi:hypothetical protein